MRTIIPRINPMHFTKKDPAVATAYMSKHMDDWTAAARVKNWEAKAYWFQPWMKTDSARLHIWTDGGVPTFRIIDRDEKTFYTGTMQQRQQLTSWPGMHIYETEYSFAGTPEGYYHAEIQVQDKIYVTDEFEVSEKSENSVFIEYKALHLYEDVLWGTGYFPRIRLYGDLAGFRPEAVRTGYDDQVYNRVLLDSKNYRIWRLFINAVGVPDWMADKLNLILGCSTILIDGRQYAVADDAKLEPVELERYPLRGWAIDLRERYARASQVYEDDTLLNGEIISLITANTKGFSSNNDEGNDIIITDIQ